MPGHIFRLPDKPVQVPRSPTSQHWGDNPACAGYVHPLGIWVGRYSCLRSILVVIRPDGQDRGRHTCDDLPLEIVSRGLEMGCGVGICTQHIEKDKPDFHDMTCLSHVAG